MTHTYLGEADELQPVPVTVDDTVWVKVSDNPEIPVIYSGKFPG